ncbi:hypothetical protein AB1Y20_009214 [Prymnesium parvum]|uniref:Actin-related protein 8 n=1 Tax=Prymnesium parvum TaxID=97485 RepID=A0AB34K3K4_PRYPA
MTRFFPASGALHALVVDHGGMHTRAGFAGDDVPTAIFPSAVGKYADASGAPQLLLEPSALGHEQIASMKIEKLGASASPEVREEVVDALLRHALRKLGADPTEQPLLLSEPIGSSCRRRTAELMFEGVGVPALLVAKAPELAAISVGRATALVLDMGGWASSAVAVVDAVAAARTAHLSHVSGGALAKLLERQLGVRLDPACLVHRKSLVPSEALLNLRREELARDLYESVCRIREKAGSSSSAVKGQAPAEYSLPDGRVLEVGAERFDAPELFFTAQPQPPHHLHRSLQSLVLSSLKDVEGDYHKDLMKNIVVTGGGSCLPGLVERLDVELNAAARACTVPAIRSHAHRMQIVSTPASERKNGVWLGGSLLASMGSHSQMWMSRAEYDEHGSALILKKGLNYIW